MFGGLLAWLVGAALFITLIGAATVAREACVTSADEVRYGDWSLEPLKIFGGQTKFREGETCESQSFLHNLGRKSL